ncbi:MAG TPA: restriction endonuclease subunit S [Prevotellaceae bacterium]|nr:restriction endonuclease subunit S [Prevotellaceae bacterium]
MEEWKEYKLGEVAEIVTGYPFPSEKYGATGKLRVVRGENVTIGKLRWDVEKHWNLDIAGLEKYLLRPDDIVIGMDGSRVGSNRALIRETDLPLILAQRVACLRAKNGFDSKYIWYTIFSDTFRKYVEAINTGTSIPHISQKQIAEFEIMCPSEAEQKRIARVLSSLDDKIDLLHRENATLEALAETLFRHYFIESPNPEWKESPLSTIATFLNGLACQKYPPKDLINRLPVLKIKELSSGITKDSDWATTDVGEEYIVHCGDVIFAWSASLMVKMWNGEDCVLNQHLFKVTSDIFPRWYYYLWCKYHLQEFISIAQSHATTMGHIKRGDLDSAMVLVPSRNEMESFTKQIEPLLKRVETNYSQINNLSFYRDNLLLRLMSGEVKVDE